MQIYDLSPTSGSSNNNAAPPNGAPEGMEYDEVNDTLREIMAMLKRWQVASQSGTLTTSGTQPAYALTSGQSLSAYAAGQVFTFTAHASSTGAVTLTVDAIGASAVVDAAGTQLGSGDIVSGGVYTVVRKAANFQLVSSQVKVTPGSETVAGVLELATNAEALTGTDTVRAITPANLTHVFNNRPATESVQGAVEMATNAEIASAATGAKAIMAEDIETASALNNLTDAATVAFDWDVAINRQLAMAGNRLLGNPTNGQPGTWRMVWVFGNDGTQRQLTFDTNYRGEIPVLNDISNARGYVLSILCLSTSHFVVSAHRGQ